MFSTCFVSFLFFDLIFLFILRKLFFPPVSLFLFGMGAVLSQCLVGTNSGISKLISERGEKVLC